MRKVFDEFKTLKRGIGLIISIQKKYAFLLVVSAIISTIPFFLSFNMMAKIINELCGDKNVGIIVVYVVITVVGNLLLLLFISAIGHLKGYYRNLFVHNEQMNMAKKLSEIDLCKLEERETNLLFEQIKEDNRSGHNTYYLCLFLEEEIKAIANAIISCGYFVNLFLMRSVPITYKIMIASIIMLSVVVAYIADKHYSYVSRDLSDKNVSSNAFFYFYDGFYDDYHAGKDVRLFNMEKLACDEQEKQCDISYNLLMNARKRVLPLGLLKNTVVTVLNIALYAFIVIASVIGSVSIGDITKYVAFVLLFVNSINNVFSKMQFLFNNNYYLKRYFSFLDIKSSCSGGTRPIKKLKFHTFEFVNVSFKYPNSPEYAIKNLSIKFDLNKRIAIVGMNGSGKSTFVKLLCGLYSPSEGQILMDGYDVSDYDRDEYFKLFSAVFQNFKLYAYPLSENISCGKEPDEEKVKICLSNAGLDKLLNKMNENIDICLYKEFDDDGVEISGGEAQKIALARALYKESPIVILDEPTASLDPISEHNIYSSFNEIVKDRATVYISHRLSSCRFCDDIFVFDNGSIVQRGAHDELVCLDDGKYYELWNAQAKYYLSE